MVILVAIEYFLRPAIPSLAINLNSNGSCHPNNLKSKKCKQTELNLPRINSMRYPIVFLLFLLVIQGCHTNSARSGDILTFINNENDYWELIKINDHKINYRVEPFTGLYFFKNEKYDLFRLKKSSFDSLYSDVEIEKDWYYNKQLHVLGFCILRIVKLDQRSFIFYSRRTKYEFKKSILPNGTRKVNYKIVVPKNK